jgi:hypothetical protein
MDYDIPASILKKHPELLQIYEALEEYNNGKSITTTCRTCNNVLQVIDNTVTKSQWIGCSEGCTSYRTSSYDRSEE